MANRGVQGSAGRLEREIERERHERALHDEARSGQATMEEEFRLKDARERADTGRFQRERGSGR